MNKPNICDRIKRSNANNEMRKSEEHERIRNLLQNRRDFEEGLQWQDRMRFDLFLAADRILEMLEEQRDANLPKTPDEPWNEKFCEAIRTIPAARRFAEDCLMDCIRKE